MNRPVNRMRPVHPGEVFREDDLAPLGLSVNGLALALGVPATRIHDCPNCGAGELKIIAAILERPVIEKILTHLGLDPQPPPRGRARAVGQD